jgi:acetyltransferase
MQIETLPAVPTSEDVAGLTEVIVDSVANGASVGFLWPMEQGEAESYWRKVIAEAVSGQRVILVVRNKPGGPIVGTAQLALEARRNGRHRAEVQKVMVRSTHRRQGIAVALMARLEAIAAGRGVRVLFLDTSEGRGGAMAFYEALGYTYVGGIPGYALDPDGTPARNAIYYKTLCESQGNR